MHRRGAFRTTEEYPHLFADQDAHRLLALPHGLQLRAASEPQFEHVEGVADRVNLAQQVEPVPQQVNSDIDAVLVHMDHRRARFEFKHAIRQDLAVLR